MRETDLRSIRILFDLQACQTPGSAQRGVGRYSTALFEAMAEIASPRQLFGLLGAQHPTSPRLEKLPRSRLLWADPLPDFKTTRMFQGGEQDAIDSHLYSSVVSTISPDVIHVSHVFEGFGERVAIPNVVSRPAGQVLSATLYDLIPMRFPEYYFQSNEFKRWYFHRLSFYHQADLLLAISESSRQDAIELLNIAPEKIITILGGVSEHFKPVADRAATHAYLRQKYDLTRPRIVLYTGGDDHRKNLAGAIEAYAAVPSQLRANTHLIVICAMEDHRKELFISIARKAGLTANDVRFLGFVPEADLVAFYAACDVFYFPSLYEGFGFPIVEAMACGAPVLSGNNSSLRELVDRHDAMFDSGSAASIAERLSAVLKDDAFAEELRRYGVERAKAFTWRNVARRALDAFDDALSRKREAGRAVAVAGLLPKPRMAMLTPLPPCRSGIADYNAQFLPYLSSHFEIDLFVDGYQCSDLQTNSTFRIFDAADFRRSAPSYDVILYEMGNSEFHRYMLPLLEEFPGVVGLHDAYLSGLIGYLDFHLGETNRFSSEMLHAHGSAARRLFAPVQANPDANGAAMVELPCTKRVIDRAIGIISHSKFNLELARTFYPQGWPAPYRIIPQMIGLAGRSSEAEITALRAQLGFKPNDFIIATFGHIAWTKWGDRLLDAFLGSELGRDSNCHLIFAGELAKDDFGLKLNDTIRKSGLQNRIKITGYLSEEDYKHYLHIADVAVQLRTKSRGGTPRGVLDCLACGLPVVVNNEASYEDYPDDVVVKLPSNPLPDDIAASLIGLRNSESERRKLSERGLDHVRKHHDPEMAAAQYAAAIHEFMARRRTSSAEHFVEKIAPHLATLTDAVGAAKLASSYFEARPTRSFARPRLVIDVSHIAQSDHRTGIQRVVKETVRAAYCGKRHDIEALAVERIHDHIVPAVDWLNQQRLLMPYETDASYRTPVCLQAGDHLLMLDSSWAAYDQFSPIFVSARAKRVPITTVIYDLLPIILPPGNFVEGGKEWFEGWLRRAIAESDGLVCISKAVADDLIAFLNQNSLARPGLKVGWWHLGSTLPKLEQPNASSSVRELENLSYFLMVGTIEPRKNHVLALDAMELLWAAGSDIKLVIAGKPGWMVEELMVRLRTHTERNKRLFLFEEVNDEEISYLYRNASILLFLSKGEGFGLPLVEAAHFGKPVVCSRIPSFVEIGGEQVMYVEINSAARLADELSDAWTRAKSGKAPDTRMLPRLTWEESTDALLGVVVDQNWYWSA